MKIQQKQQGDKLTVIIDGRVDTLTAPQLQSDLKLTGVQNIIFDLKKMDYVSSAGLRVFLETFKEIKAHQGTMKLLHLKPLVREIFYEVGFDKVFDIGK